MLIYLITRSDADEACNVIETARLTREEAETYIAEQVEHYKANGYCADDWQIEPVDMPLALEPEPVMAQ